MIVVGAILGLVVMWRLLSAILGGDVEAPIATGTGPTGSIGTRDAPPAPPGSRASAFPSAVAGTRLELKVIALGDHPPGCAAESIKVDGVVRTVYHHRCVSDDHGDRYFLLVEVTNLTDARVFVSLEIFGLGTPGGSERAPFANPPLGSNSTRFLPESRAIAAGQVLKGWITFDGTDGFTPADLTYADGEQPLTVVFEGDWQ
jgi:hypothetical protein